MNNVNYLQNIDQYMKASDIIELLQDEISRSQENIKKYSRADGFAKRGKSNALNAAYQSEFAAKLILSRIERKLNEE